MDRRLRPCRHRVRSQPIELFDDVKAVRLPEGTAFDPGGIGKGLAGDLVAAALLDEGAGSVQVELGGDVRVAGPPWSGDEWQVQVDDVDHGAAVAATISLPEGGVATSSVMRRRWRRGGVDVHHLLDPSTGSSADTDLDAVTAVAPTLWWAEVVAKVALMAGSDRRPLGVRPLRHVRPARAVRRAPTLRDHPSTGDDAVNSQVWWFVARSSGIIAWALLTLSVVWGLLLSTKVSATRIAARKLRPAWILDLHRHLGGLAVIFTAIHLIGIAADSYVTFGWADIFVPMASEWKPGAVAFGVVSLYLLVAIEATSLAIRRLPRTAWRWVHRTSFVLYATATYHGILAGTDAGNQWFRVASWISIVVVVVLTVRLLVVLRRKSVSDRRRPVDSPEPAVVPLPIPADPDVVPCPSPALDAVHRRHRCADAVTDADRAAAGDAVGRSHPATARHGQRARCSARGRRCDVVAADHRAAGTTAADPATARRWRRPSHRRRRRRHRLDRPRRALAEVSSGGRGGDDLAPPPGTT